MVLLIDNYDSFSYNLYQMMGAALLERGENPDIRVVRNDECTAEEVEAMRPSHIVLSPGPGRPKDAGICETVVTRMMGHCPILGICLGHQAICEVLGARITYAKTLLHGKSDMIHIANGAPLFRGLPPLMEACRYHSLAAERSTLPDDLLVIAEDDSGEVMGVKHKSYDLYGLQFHPESILTPGGGRILENFLKLGGAAQ